MLRQRIAGVVHRGRAGDDWKILFRKLCAMSLLSEALRHKLIPWSRHHAEERFIIARPKMNVGEVPDGVRLVRRRIAGRRVLVRGERDYGNSRGIRAKWPEAEMHEWEAHKLLCVLDGRIDFQAGHYAILCGEGFNLMLPAGTPQPDGTRSYHGKGLHCDLLNVVLHPHAIQCFISHAQDGQPVVQCHENYLFKNGNLVKLFEVLTEEVMGTRANSTRIGAEVLSLFWQTLLRDVEEQRYITPGPIGRPEVTHEKSAGFEADLFSYIQTHLNQSLTLEKAARGMYLSRAQFSRRMRENTGKTFIQFLTDYRIAEAKVLLEDSEWTITAIANFVGFKSNNYFQMVFRRATGQTPGQYRILIRKKR